MQKDLPLVALHGELVTLEKFLVLLLFDLGHNVLRLLQKGVNNAKQPFLPVRVMSAAAEFNACRRDGGNVPDSFVYRLKGTEATLI